MNIKVSTWHEHQKFGRVKLYGSMLNGVATIHQIYKNGVSMLFFERGDRNAPCGFSREEIQQFEALLSNTINKKPKLKKAD